MPSAQHLPLPIDDLCHARRRCRFGQIIHYFDSLDSTNTHARRLALEGAAEGTVVIAETQTKGRGRLGRTWVSPPFRNLYLSLIVRPPVATAEAPQLVLVAGLAVAETVREWTAGAAIKWPNDVLIDGRKVAGILTEMEADGDRVRFVIIGIGVNLNSAATDFPPELHDKAVGLCTAMGAPIDRVAFADRLLSRLEERYELFVHQGFAAVRPLWEGLSCLTGKPVEVDDGYRRYAGVAVGIADDGSLRLRDAAGSEIRVVVGDVTIVGGYDGA
jgi:BirA family biotin operon repressor/biotin-[acetyl-CoA-carboxylase] ligase